ncbi:MAG: endonuclease mitochondrial, partial [Acidobacteriota bacterium]|nr:endonuclease mitochondrial [Acidobacteriota bacterium]
MSSSTQRSKQRASFRHFLWLTTVAVLFLQQLMVMSPRANAANGVIVSPISRGSIVSPVSLDHVVISQIYGGGGNNGSFYKNDFVELYNPTSNPISLTGWSLQYASAAGSSWSVTDLAGTIGPGKYFLIRESQGAGGSADLPAADAVGNIAMSATSAKVALINNADSLGGACPVDPNIVDFVGYGASASCYEGTGPTATLSNSSAAVRKLAGDQDTNNNSDDFSLIDPPTPRNSASGPTGGEIAPVISSTTPGTNATNVLIGANVNISFSEAVNVSGSWYGITCQTSGAHPAAVSGGPTTYVLDPATNFANSEQCTVTISASLVSDQDTNDPPDQMAADYSWTFTTISSSGAVRNPDDHLVMGNPTNATVDTANENNYLMKKPEYALSYNRSRAIPNWTSWHLDTSWLGSQARTNTFRADPDLPVNWYHVNENSYVGSGFDRGHMTPSGDRTFSYEENAATFVMTNMVPQAPDNNQVTWEGLESYSRQLVSQGNELYIVSGGYGQGGTGRNGLLTTVDQGRVVVPSKTWKVILVLSDGGGDDAARVSNSTRTIAVIIPNEQGVDSDWRNYIVSVDEVEALTGENFFSNVPDAIQAVIEGNADGNTHPTSGSQSVTTREDNPLAIVLTATDPESNALTYSIATQPAHGSLSGSGSNLTYTPAANFNGPDTFTFTASDKYLSSVPATININVTSVNDAPSFVKGADQTSTDTSPKSISNWATLISAGPPDESGQSLTFLTSNSNNALFSSQPAINPSGTLTYSTVAGANGTATVTVQLKDNGGTANGGADTSAAQTFSINVQSAPPLLITEDGTSRAVALDSVTMMRGPFPLNTIYNFSSDHRTRVMLFAANAGLEPG